MHPGWAERGRELAGGYQQASIEFERRCTHCQASLGGNPPVVVLADPPSIKKGGPSTYTVVFTVADLLAKQKPSMKWTDVYVLDSRAVVLEHANLSTLPHPWFDDPGSKIQFVEPMAELRSMDSLFDIAQGAMAAVPHGLSCPEALRSARVTIEFCQIVCAFFSLATSSVGRDGPSSRTVCRRLRVGMALI
jgi:hypothetical protein